MKNLVISLKIFAIPALLLVLIWIIYFIHYLYGVKLYFMALLPQHLSGLPGILGSPLIHFEFSHIIANTIPFIVLGLSIFYVYPKSARPVFFIVYFSTGILVWFFGRPVYHIGASGIIYGLLAFLFFIGVFKRDAKAIAISLIVVFLYGGLIWGVLPVTGNISWESHLFGSISGFVCAIIFRNKDSRQKYDWEDDDDDDGDEPLEISYDKKIN